MDVLICRSPSYIKLDAADREFQKILTFGVTGDENQPARDFFEVLGCAEFWQDVQTVELGKSMFGWLPVVLLRAISQIVADVSGKSVAAPDYVTASPQTQQIQEALTRWLTIAATVNNNGKESLSVKELTYLVFSGGHRSGALIKVLGAFAPGKRFSNIADVGAGLGLISLMLAAQPELAVRAVSLVEPKLSYIQNGQELWSLAASRDLSFEFQQNLAEGGSVKQSHDLVFFGQCVYLINEKQRAEVFARMFQALAPGGLLVINEIVRSNAAAPDLDWDARYPNCPRINELVATLAMSGEVSVLRRSSNWEKAEDPRSMSATDVSTDSFFVVRRR